ncbi:hypothetical protein QTP88_007876 [Uroleucon formosanum]
MIHGNIKDFLAQIEKNKLLTLDSVGQGKRDKRAIFPTIVKTAKVIYGLCDVNCLWNSFLNLKKFRESGSNELKLQDKRIKIIEVKKNRDEEKAKPGLESIHELKKITSAHEVKGQILEHLINIKVLLDQYTFEINSLTDIIQTAKLGQIHPSLISPNELILQLKDIKDPKEVPDNCELMEIKIHASIFHKLKYKNHSSTGETVFITCDNDKQSINHLLEGVGLFTLNETCKAYATRDILIPGEVNFQEEYLDFIPDSRNKQYKYFTGKSIK